MITDTILLKKFDKNKEVDPVVRANAIASLSENDPILKRLSIPPKNKPYLSDARICIARMKMVTQEPRIKLRFPRLQCFATIEYNGQEQYSGSDGFSFDLDGEYVTISFRQDGKKIAESHWITKFPQSNPGRMGSHLLPAIVDGTELTNILIQRPEFTQEDISELINSRFEEVRIAAINNLSDQLQIAKLAVEDSSYSVRQTAVAKIDDQVLLSKIANTDKEYEVREQAKKRIVEIVSK
jgi:hypothetical protein